MSDLQLEIWNELCKLSGEEVARLFTDWLGDQVLDKDFRIFLGTEGYMPEYEEDEPKQEDEEENEEDRPADIKEYLGGDFMGMCKQFPTCEGCPLHSFAFVDDKHARIQFDCDEYFAHEKAEFLEGKR